VTERNAHPLTSSADEVHVVVNGIVENYVALKARLSDMGAVYTSETDAETIAHLIAHHLATGDFVEAVRRAYNDLRATSRSSPCTATTPTRSSARARSARWSSAWARTSASWPPTSPPSCPRPAACSGSRTASWSSSARARRRS
jgi:hypothetical protein